jgi:hypothetical protein
VTRDIAARYEFRSFDCVRTTAAARAQLAERLGASTVERSAEIYTCSVRGSSTNVKIRDGRIDAKELIAVRCSLEQWRPAGTSTFPLAHDWIEYLCERCAIPRNVCTQPSIHAFVIAAEACSALRVGHTRKTRWKSACGDVAGEIARASINGAVLTSLAIESENAGALQQTLAALELDGRENVSYPTALQRLFALVPLPQQHPDRVHP